MRRLNAMSHRALRRQKRRDERGYIAVTTGLLLLVLISFSAFAVDVGNWYLTGQQAQRAADAAALAGVVKLPGDQTGAYSAADTFAATNGFSDTATTTVVPSLGGAPTRLRVDVTRTVDNIFGPLLGKRTTTISRHAIADYVGPVPMGSPCNEYGNDPDATSATRSTACNTVQGNFWANVNGPLALKQNGDSFSSVGCSTSVAGRDGCTGSTNNEYDPAGYMYTIAVKQSMPSVTIELFDPVFAEVGLTCGYNSSDPVANFGTGTTRASMAVNPYHLTANTNAGDRYAIVASGSASSAAWPWCTGDNSYSGSQVQNTTFTVRAPGTSMWDPMSGAVVCSRTFEGTRGNLYNVLNASSTSTYRQPIAEGFRRWVTNWCQISNPVVGDYSLQVTSNVGGAFANADTGNRYAVRVLASDLSSVTVSGRQRMGMFANKNSGVTSFHLARILSGTAGSILKISLYDVGDSTQTGTIKINPPGGGNYSGCTGTGVTTSIGSNCSFTVTAGSPSVFNGRLQVVSVPIPTGYTCNDNDPTACWVTLTYDYGSGAQPTDVTTWSANLEGDPIRLIE
jgi:Flp pilus assembly protein TadG